MFLLLCTPHLMRFSNCGLLEGKENLSPNHIGQIELQTWCGSLIQLHLIGVILVILGGSCSV